MFGLTKIEEDKILQSKSHGMALQILRFGLRPEGATAEEFMDSLDMTQARFQPRFSELKACGCLVHTGRRRTKSKRFAKVYQTSKTASFRQFLAFSRQQRANREGLRTSKSPAKNPNLLSDSDRMLLHAGRTILRSWNGGDQKRRTALVAFVARLTEIAKLAQKGNKETV